MRKNCSGVSTGQDRCCVIIQLNRAIDFRDKLLDSIYHFKSIPGAPTGSKFNKHEFMTRLGLIKQVMKTELDNLRNDLEHIDPALTPPAEVCRRLCEFTWYYLRSTDRLAGSPLAEVTLTDEVTEFEVAIDLHRDRKPWAFSIFGPFRYDMVSTTSVSGYVTVDGSAHFTNIDGQRACFVKGELILSTDAAFDLVRRSLNALI